MFYPAELSKSQWFEYYASKFDAVEINNTFYQLPTAKTFRTWRKIAPTGFCYTLKFSRYGSHLMKLKNPRGSTGQFLERAELLKELLGPILVHLPPHWNVDGQRLAEFLDAAPAKHRWALEFRDKSWLCEDVFNVLRKHNVALCIHDLIKNHPYEITADWVYLRFHGANGGNYPRRTLLAASRRIKQHLKDGLDVHVYFNNDAHGYAVANALDLRRYIQSE